MSDIQKCPNLVRGGGGANIFKKCLKFKNQFDQRGGQHFSKMSEIQKCPKCRKGGGGTTLIGTCPKFSRFSILTPPLSTLGRRQNNKARKFGTCPNRGGGRLKKPRNVPISIWEF